MITRQLLVLWGSLWLGTASAITQLGPPPAHPVSHQAARPLTADQCLRLATPALKQRDPTAYHALLVRAAAQHAGMAALILAKETEQAALAKGLSPAQQATVTQQLLTAAHFGYPIAAYQQLAKLTAPTNPLLARCYANLARLAPNPTLVALCHSRLGSTFHQVVNVGRQTAIEHTRYAAAAEQRFCQGDDATVLSAEFSSEEVVQLRQAFCHGKRLDTTLAQQHLKQGDMVITATGIQVWMGDHVVPCSAPLQVGDIVYRQNPPLTAYRFDGKALQAVAVPTRAAPTKVNEQTYKQ